MEPIKKYTFAFVLSLMTVFTSYCQEEGGRGSDRTEDETNNYGYREVLRDINQYLETFDNGYYGPLIVEDGYIFCTIKDGRKSRIPVEEIGEVRMMKNDVGVAMFCASGDCVKGVTGSYFPKMSFRTSGKFDYDPLKSMLEEFVLRLRN
ncbi:MAG: hypothetical protein CMB99_11820 [Flavobacteriaceae bacterium]|nr:hypothetical protein [Flavobacteriaceae bacterium]|tara:strand:- start:194400 stop:194846 length:447 start_codon:yes stop_codon:yes gene_type:complete